MIDIHLHQMLVKQDDSLKVGTPVLVRWGYGLSFRAEAKGMIVKVFEKSVQVKLDHDVLSPMSDKIGWNSGFILKGIPRYNLLNEKWNTWNSVTPIEITGD